MNPGGGGCSEPRSSHCTPLGNRARLRVKKKKRRRILDIATGTQKEREATSLEHPSLMTRRQVAKATLVYRVRISMLTSEEANGNQRQKASSSLESVSTQGILFTARQGNFMEPDLQDFRNAIDWRLWLSCSPLFQVAFP